MTTNLRADMRWSLGRHPSARVAFLVLISLMAWISEAILLEWVFSSRTQHVFRPLYYVYPIIHLLPWLAGLQWFGKISKAAREGVMDERSAALAYSAVLGILCTTYVVLASAGSLLLFSADNMSLIPAK